MRAACATPYKGIVRGLWKRDCLTEHGCPLARSLGMPSGHVAYVSFRGDAWIHYYLLMNFTTKLFLIDRSVIWVHGTYNPSLTWRKFVCSTNLEFC